jgi:hypothetical protein
MVYLRPWTGSDLEKMAGQISKFLDGAISSRK